MVTVNVNDIFQPRFLFVRITGFLCLKHPLRRARYPSVHPLEAQPVSKKAHVLNDGKVLDHVLIATKLSPAAAVRQRREENFVRKDL